VFATSTHTRKLSWRFQIHLRVLNVNVTASDHFPNKFAERKLELFSSAFLCLSACDFVIHTVMTIHDDISNFLGFRYSPQKSVSSQGLTRKRTVSEVIADSKESRQRVAAAPTKRPKGSEQSRRERYLKEDYTSCLLMSSKLEAYDGPNGRRICHSQCKFGCREHFRSLKGGDVMLRKEMADWWGEGVSHKQLVGNLAQDILLNSEKIEGQGVKTRWFVADKQVCRNFSSSGSWYPPRACKKNRKGSS
jgi:hypothetical protein